ncbi:hypothetical protein M404DRAFT_20327 [Pisolithus tinctorius Marx 270]|uniref:CCHC-type domain-containing protein n=1 Tax=Pisolithus tinctorius Marx 270 TaxID=870435 RepID=A0A0C3PD50_PISTI|nr:hypothetical protein M404DRAFT_20327 [Pisolithus tinctorius Marx 270]
MTTAIPVTTDSLLGNVPKLDIKGANWAIFSLRFQTAVKAKELWSHFDGTSPCPAMAEKRKYGETLTTQRIPDSTALRVHSLNSIAAMWNEIVCEYTEKGAYAQTDLRTKFLNLQCPIDGDIHQFLDDLCTKRDELAAIGVQIEEKDYCSTIIQSLPKYLASFASGQLATAHLYSPTQTIDPDVLISLIIEESKRRSRKETRHARSKAKNRDGDEAMSLTPGNSFGRGRGNGRNGSQGGSSRGYARQRGPCWNCGSREHYKAQCPDPDKKKETPPAVTKGSTHAVTFDSDEEGAFSVHPLEELDDEVPL